MRKFIFAVLLLLGVIFVIGKLTEVQSIVETLQRGDLRFLALALFFQLLAMVSAGLSYQAIYRALQLQEYTHRLVMMAAASNFLNIVAPSGGVSGMAVFLSEARRGNYSPGKAAVAGALFLLLDYGAFLIVLGLGLTVQFRRNDLDAGEVVASIVLLVLALVLGALIFLGLRSSEMLARALALMARQVNRLMRPFIKRDYLSEQRAYDFARDASEGLGAIMGRRRRVIVASLLALVKHACFVLVLFSNFMAFRVPVSWGTIIAGYSIGYLFLIVSPTPAGLGFVEGALTLTLRSMYVRMGAAAVITLGYRAFTFWLPFLLGMLSLRWLEKSRLVPGAADSPGP